MSSAMYSGSELGSLALTLAKDAGKALDYYTYTEDMATGGVRLALISSRSAKAWVGDIPVSMRVENHETIRAFLQREWPDTFGPVEDPRAEKIAAIQRLALQIATDNATMAQRMAELTKLLKELE